MQRAVILTVGKTHSGKTTFARELEQRLPSVVIDQDNQAEFLHTHYAKLVPQSGQNELKFGLTRYLVDYAIARTSLHLIVCNSNLSRPAREQLLRDMFPATQFVRIVVYLDMDEAVLRERIAMSTRSTAIFRKADTTFHDVLSRQQCDAPTMEEAEHVLVVRNEQEREAVMAHIVTLIQQMNGEIAT